MAFTFTAPLSRTGLPIEGQVGFSIDVPPRSSITPFPPEQKVDAVVSSTPDGDFRGLEPTKGKIVNLSTRDVLTFMFNPNEITMTNGWDWAVGKIPGMSQPVRAGGSGADRPITFSLYFDSDRGRMKNRKRITQGGELPDGPTTVAPDDPTSFDLTLELNKYHELTYPVQDPTSPTTTGRASPPRCSLTLGTLFSGVICVVESIETRIINMTNRLEPKRAYLNMTLKKWSNVSLNGQTFSNPSAGQ